MSRCAVCSRELSPEWKYCIYCGAAVIPGAIRPEPEAAPSFPVPAIVAIVVAGVGVLASIGGVAFFVINGWP